MIAGFDNNAKDYIERLYSISENNTNIIFTGAVYGTEKETLISNCFAFCLPSSLEGLPITLLEAMSYSKICLASDIPACQEALGDTGIFFNINDFTDLTSKLIDLNDNLQKYSTLGLQSFERVKSNFTWERITSKYVEYCVEILKNKKRRKYKWIYPLLLLIDVTWNVKCVIFGRPDSDKNLELVPSDYEYFPDNYFNICNITGGEPLMRNDLEEIIEVMFCKAKRVVISTAGWHTERILKIAERFPNIGVRVSIEGLSQTNDDLRGRKGGFDRGLKLLLGLEEWELRTLDLV